MKFWSRLTQRLCQRRCGSVMEDIMNFVLQVHNSCKQPVATTITLSPWPPVKGSASVAWCTESHCQRPVQSDIKHIKPECPVGPTLEPCDTISCLRRDRIWRDGREVKSVWLRPFFGSWLIELRFYFSAAGTVLAKRAVAVQNVATARCGCSLYGRGGTWLVEAAVSQMRLQHVPSLSCVGERALYRVAGDACPGQAEAHVAHRRAGLWEKNWMAAEAVGRQTSVHAGVVIFVTGMITHSNVSNLNESRGLIRIQHVVLWRQLLTGLWAPSAMCHTRNETNSITNGRDKAEGRNYYYYLL